MPLLLLALLAALALAAPASAAIVPQEGMAGARLGMSPAEVREVLGAPSFTRTRSDFAGRYTERYYTRPAVKVTFRRAESGSEVTAIFTRRGRERTAEAVGVGTTERALRRRLAEEHCETFRAPGFRRRSCHIGRFEPGRTVTDFRIDRRGRVASVLIGIVID